MPYGKTLQNSIYYLYEFFMGRGKRDGICNKKKREFDHQSFLQGKALYCCGQWGDALFASLAETTEPEVMH